VRNEQVLRMFLLSALDPADARIALARIAENTAAGVAELRRVRTAHADKPLIGREGFGQLAAEYGLRQYQAAHDWAIWAMTQLDENTESVGLER
jgi:hypothetical protein